MYKKISKVAFIAMITLFAGYTAYNSQKENYDLSSLVLDNVEALARPEGAGFNCQTNSDYSAICDYYNSGAYCPCGF